VDVGQPSAERLHKASKRADRVAVCTYPDATALKRTVQGAKIHDAERIEVMCLTTTFLDELEAVVPQRGRLEFVHTGGQIYVTAGSRTVDGAVTRTMLAP
jgi:uncharacterized protein YaeQ